MKHETPLLDQLESGPWPSFVSDLKAEAVKRAKNEAEHRVPDSQRLQLKIFWVFSSFLSRTETTHWKHGGIVGVFGYGGGVIGRYCDQPTAVPRGCPFPHHARCPAWRKISTRQLT